MKTRKNSLHILQYTLHLPFNRLLSKTTRSFSRKEKTVFFALLTILLVSAALLLFRVNNAFLVEIPLRGGMITEGIVTTTPPKINPIAASPFTSPVAENDLIALIYSGLMKVTKDGGLEPDLAESYTVSEDGRVYTFILKNNLKWHDGEPLTSDDLAFTIQKVQDPQVNSRNKVSWEGVVVENPDSRTIIFTLAEPYAPFLQNTTLGILPRHLWKDVHPEKFADHPLNVRPIGSGPYMVKKVKTDSTDVVKYYDLEAFPAYALGEPYITTVRVQFFSHEEDLIAAYKKGRITSMNSISPKKAAELSDTFRVERLSIPRIFGAFFNQNKAEIFTKKEVREALDIAVDRRSVIDHVLFGYAKEITGPLPPGSLGYTKGEPLVSTSTEGRTQQASQILEGAGWEKGEDGIYIKKTAKENLRLSFSIATTEEAPELYEIAQILKRTWGDVGAEVTIESYATKDQLENHAIRPRAYDVLLFGEIIGVNSDPYAFWHSSQRLDPGLNIASYANITVDGALEKIRKTPEAETRIEQYRIFQKEIRQDIPAIFLYAPELVYVTDNRIQGLDLAVANTPSDRFSDIYAWFLKTEFVWRAFVGDAPIL